MAPELHLPIQRAATETYAFLARKGAGKTFAAGVLVEQLLDAGVPVIIIDPIGNWGPGLRLLADGKSPGYPIPVFGGEHGDVDFDIEQGEALGQLVVERGLSAVIDVSHFRKNERKRFVADFAEAFFLYAKRSANRRPRILVLEEAQLFAPQRVQKGEERMLGAIEDVVRLGRNYSIGCVMISQRPQSINKEVLNQVECLFVGQLNAAHERKAIEDWVLERKAAKGWTRDLPSLPVGTMIVWSPQWLKVMVKVKINKKKTYDASATLEPGLSANDIPMQALGAVDVQELHNALIKIGSPTKSTSKKHVPVAGDPNLQAELEAANARFQLERDRFRDALSGIGSQVDVIQDHITALQTKLSALSTDILVDGIEAVRAPPPALPKPKRGRPAVQPRPAQPAPQRRAKPTSKEGLKLVGGAVRMLQSAASFYPGTMTKAQIARAANMTASGGTFAAYWTMLFREGLLETSLSGRFRASEKGLALLGENAPEVPQGIEERIAFWGLRLKTQEGAMLRLIAERGSITRDELAREIKMTASGGAFNGYIGTLTRNDLIEKQGESLQLHPWLWGDE